LLLIHLHRYRLSIWLLLAAVAAVDLIPAVWSQVVVVLVVI
jgi:hypothetical protein